VYGELRYLDRNGDIHETYVQNCKTVYFIADVRRGPAGEYNQHFNFNILPPPVRATGEVKLTLIDPDIRYPGNGGGNTIDGGDGDGGSGSSKKR
jgi:hypothetical protein